MADIVSDADINELASASPAPNTPEHAIWYAALRYADAVYREGVTDENKEVVEVVEVLRQQGETGTRIIEWLAVVYMVSWPRRERLRMAWKLLRGTRTRRWFVDVKFEKRDLWIGAFWDRRDDGLHVWITPLPTLVLHIRHGVS